MIVGNIPGVFALVTRWCVRVFVRRVRGSVGLLDVVTCGAVTL